jgi:ketosteroid isomerase-like protein
MDSPPTPLEAVKALWASWEKHGAEGVLRHMSDDAEWVAYEGRIYRGREEIEAFVQELNNNGVQIEPRPYSFEPHGDDCVIVAGGLRTRSRRGLSDVQRHWLYRVENGEITHVESLSSREDAIRAAERVCQEAAA